MTDVRWAVLNPSGASAGTPDAAAPAVYLLRLDPGTEIVGALAAFAAGHKLGSASVAGLGAVSACELGYFDRAAQTYLRRQFREELEIASLTGNLAQVDGKPFWHCHAVMSDREFRCVGGHVFSAVVGASAELTIVAGTAVVRRQAEGATGLKLLQIP